MSLLMLPLMILNLVGGLASGIWLAFLHKWPILILGALLGFFGGKPISLMLLVGGALFGTPAIRLSERGKNGLGLFFVFLNGAFLVTLISVWCLGIFAICLAGADSASRIPLTIWAYGVATGPWAYLGQADEQAGGNPFSAFSVFFCEIACIVIGLIAVILRSSFGILILVFVSIMLIDLTIQFGIVLTELKTERNHNIQRDEIATQQTQSVVQNESSIADFREKPKWVLKQQQYTGKDWVFDEAKQTWRPEGEDS